MLRNRQCECCGTWDKPIGPTYLRPEVKKAIDNCIAFNDRSHFTIEYPPGGLTQAEYDYFYESVTNYSRDFYSSKQLIFNFK